MLIYLALGLLQGSSDLTRSDTDVITVGASNALIGTYLVLLRVEIGRLTQIYEVNLMLRRRYAIRQTGGLQPPKHLKVLRNLLFVGFSGSNFASQNLARLCPLILTLRWAAVSRYAALRSSDFPPLPTAGANTRSANFLKKNSS